MQRLVPALVNRTLCPDLGGAVHFSAPIGALRGAAPEESCASFVNVGGLLPASLGTFSPASEWSAAARMALQHLCSAAFPVSGEQCLDSLRVAADCGSHSHCVSARGFLVGQLLKADDPAAWGGEPPNYSVASTLHEPATQPALREGRAPVESESGADAASHDNRSAKAPMPTSVLTEAASQQATIDHAGDLSPGVESSPRLPHVPQPSSPPLRSSSSTSEIHQQEGHILSMSVPTVPTMPTVGEMQPSLSRCLDADTLTSDAIMHSTNAMEDFLLRSARRSATAVRALRLLYTSLGCDPTHQKSWYRLGFLLHRQLNYAEAATLALEHASRLAPSNTGPAHSELTWIHLRAIMEDEGADHDHLAHKAQHAHTEAMQHNPALAIHTLKAYFGGELVNNGFAEVVAAALRERAKRKHAREHSRSLRPPPPPPQSGAPPASVELTVCEATRAARDVLLLLGEEAKATAYEERLLSELSARSLPPPVYIEPGAK